MLFRVRWVVSDDTIIQSFYIQKQNIRATTLNLLKNI